MIYKNAEIYNVCEIKEGETEGSITWLRLPERVYEQLETEQGKKMSKHSTGVELRFVMKSDTVTLRMRTPEGTGVFHVYRGSIQGGWEDCELNKVLTNESVDYVIKKSDNLPKLKKISDEFNLPFAPEVVRVIFDRGIYEIVDIIGEIEPPKKEQLPQKTLMCYGSSITHGSVAIDRSHMWTAVLAHNIKMDCRNLGMAGSCCMEPAVVDYIASEGEKGNWDMATLELGINVLGWDEDKITERVNNTLDEIAGRNPDKQVFVISPFYCDDDYNNGGIMANRWRRMIEEIVKTGKHSNVTYINGLDLLGDMSLISADEVHPNIYGMAQIAERITNIIRDSIERSV